MIDRTKALMRLFNRRLSYRAIFLNEVGQVKAEAKAALKDLRRFCHVDDAGVTVAKNGNIDPIAMGIAAGRREVWLRLQHYLTLDEETLLKLKEEKHDD